MRFEVKLTALSESSFAHAHHDHDGIVHDIPFCTILWEKAIAIEAPSGIFLQVK